MHYKYETKILGKRVTFNFIMKLQNICDFLTSILIIVHAILFEVGRYSFVFEVTRDIVYGLEIVILVLMAFDRYLAISYPTSTKWKVKRIKIFFGCCSLLTSSVNILLALLFEFDIECVARIYTLWANGIACFLMLFTNIGLYLRLFIVFYFQTKKLTIEQRNQEERQRVARLIKFGRFLFLINVVYIICLLPVTKFRNICRNFLHWLSYILFSCDCESNHFYIWQSKHIYI